MLLKARWRRRRRFDKGVELSIADILPKKFVSFPPKDEVVRLRSTQQPSALSARRLLECNRPIANWRHGDRKVATLGIAQCHSIYAQSFSTKFGANVLGFSFRLFQNGFFGICFQCFVNNISEKLSIFWTFSWPIPPRKCWYSRRGATLAPPTMRELRTSLACLPRSLSRIFNASYALMTGLQHDWDAWTGRWVPCNSTSSVHWLAGLVPAELHGHPTTGKDTEKFLFFTESLRPVYGVQTVFFLLLPWLFKVREISWWKVVVTGLTSWVTTRPSEKRLRKVWVHPIQREVEPNF